jgi:pyruvate dehydrogenase E2 component (dihydrolipoamide acetyltransferase)
MSTEHHLTLAAPRVDLRTTEADWDDADAAMNVLWTDGALVTPPSVSIGVPIASAKGRVTPVIRDADKLTVREIASLTRNLKERADDGLLRQHEFEGGVCTVSKLGMFGVEAFAAIANPLSILA